MSHAPDLRTWFELFCTLAGGVAVMVGMAAIVARRMPTAVWQRTVWQISTLTIGFWLISELTGTARGLSDILSGHLFAVHAVETGGRAAQQTTDVLSDFGSLRADDTAVGTGTELAGNSRRESAAEWHALAIDAFTPSDMVATQPPSEASGDFAGLAQLPLDVPRPQRSTWLPAWMWFAGSATLLLRMFVGRALLEIFRWRHQTSVTAALHDKVQSLARRLGLRRHVRVIVVPELRGPIAFGTLRPTVGLPVQFAEQFNVDQQDAMLAHELGHLAAHDSAWQALSDLLAAMLWWHPCVWWARRALRNASEWAADEMSLSLPNGPESLATSLLSLGGQLVKRPAGAIAIEGNGFRSSLGRRVDRLLHLTGQQQHRPIGFSMHLIKLFGPVVLIAVALVSTAWSRSSEFSQGETMFQSVDKSWRQSLAVLLFSGVLGSSDVAALQAQDDPKISQPANQDAFAFFDEDDDKKSLKRKESDDDRPAKKATKDAPEKKPVEGKIVDDDADDSIGQLKARLKQLEAENAKLRDALESKQSATPKTSDLKTQASASKTPYGESLKGPKSEPTPEALQGRMRQLQEIMAKLQKEGRQEEAEKVAAEAREIEAQLHKMSQHEQAKVGLSGKYFSHAELAERLEHAKREVEEHERAGRKEQAQALRQEMEKIADHFQQLQRKGFAPPGPQLPPELAGVIKDLSAEVQKLRAEVQELRQLVKERASAR